MTSPADKHNSIQATNTLATTATSYASAAGAPKLSAPAPAPLVATGSSRALEAQNAQASSAVPVNGSSVVVPPAVPAVARGTSANGSGADHSRHSSTAIMAAHGPNPFTANGSARPDIRFGFDSPALAQSTPQAAHAAPIPIPGTAHQHVPSPTHSPSPIPQPSASGGRPPSGLQQPSAQMTFGSLSSDGERHVRQGSVPPNPNALASRPGAHYRRESSHSLQGGDNRGNFAPQGGRGRGFNPHNNPQYNNGSGPSSNSNSNSQVGYPPSNQFRNGPGQGRGMPPSFQPQPRNMPYNHSPQSNRSPALVPSMPITPNVPPATMQANVSPMPTPPQYHYAPPMSQPHHQVQPPSCDAFDKSSFKPHSKKSKARREHARSLQSGRQVESMRALRGSDPSQPQRRFQQQRHGQHGQQWRDNDHASRRVVSSGVVKPVTQSSTQDVPILPPQSPLSLNSSPESGGFEYVLTWKHQGYGYPPQQVDQFGRPIPVQYAFGNTPSFMAASQASSPGFNNQQFAPSYHQQGHSMSRSPSQPERPSSTNPQAQPLIVSSSQPSTANTNVAASAASAAAATAVAAKAAGATNFVKPRKSAAIQIKTTAGEIVDTSNLKQPASPAPSGQSSKTPPVVTSTSTPPQQASTPSHGRSESTARKSAKEIQDELKQKIKAATEGNVASEATKGKDQTALQEAASAASEVSAKDVPGVTSEASTEKPVEERFTAEQSDKMEQVEKQQKRPKQQAEQQAKKQPEEQPEKKPEKQLEQQLEKQPEQQPAKQPEPVETSPGDNAANSSEDDFERMALEMEAAEAEREKAEEEHVKRVKAERAEKKKKEEEERKSSAAEQDRKLREQEREMERLEEEKERRRKEEESSGKTMSVAEALAAARSGKEEADATSVDSVADKLSSVKIGDDKAAGDAAGGQKRGSKPAALNLAPLNTKPVEPPQPSAALQSLKSARFLQVMDQDIYPTGINSPNPALNAAVTKKGKSFKYDAAFLLQFQKVFTEQPSLEFHQQVKSLIGDGSGSARAQTPRQPSSRGGAFSMGTFNAPPPGRTLPPGTSSEQRLAMSSGTMPRPPVGSIGSFRGPGGAFPGVSMSRTSSQSRAGAPSSPSGRQSSRSTRGSRRDFTAKDAQAAKTMPLTAGQDIKPIAVSSTGWKPTSIGSRAVGPPGMPSGYLDPEMVQRKVKSALNKMTPENFDKLADQILAIAGQSKDESDGRTLRQVIQLTFEKATDEAHWASMYARFCKRMLENMSPDVRDERIKDKSGNVVSGGNLFRKYLLNRCQEDFERGWAIDLPAQPKEEEAEEEEGNEGSKKAPAPGDAAMLSDEYYKLAAAKRRGLGLVQFIGELYKLGMLTERIMHECVHKLVDYKGVPDEAEIESLCKLLRTIGGNLDSTEKGRPMMDAYFQRIQTIIELPELMSRLKFMLMDVVDLRRAEWVSKEGNKGPKTLEEVRVEAEAATAKAQETTRHNNARGPGGRPVMGRGDARNFSGGYVQQTSNQVGMDDLRRLKGTASRTSSQNVMLGPTSMFSSRSNSGRRLGPPGSLGRPGEDSGASSRTGTPPTGSNSNNTNAFSLLANMESEHPGSPPSAGPSPSLAKVVPDSEKKESE